MFHVKDNKQRHIFNPFESEGSRQ